MVGNEKDFKDIRKNYILISIIFILFLIYGNNIEINNFFFTLKENGFFISGDETLDMLIILSFFYLYVLFRYFIYGKDLLNENSYEKLKIYDLFSSFSKHDFNFKKSKLTYDNAEDESVNSIVIDTVERNINFTVERGTQLIEVDSSYVDINDIKIFKNYIRVNLNLGGVGYIYLKSNIKFNIIKILFKKEFSDYIWPLGFIFIVIFILIVKVLNYIINSICFV